MSSSPSAASRAALAARLLALAAVAGATAAAALHLATPPAARADLLATPEITVGPATALAGAFLLGRRRGRRTGALLLLIGTAATAYVLSRALVAADLADGALSPAGSAAAWVAAWSWALAFVPFAAVLPLVFPHGTLPSPRWRGPLAAATGALAGLVVVAALAPGPVAGLPGVDNPLGVPALAPARRLVEQVLGPVLALLTLTGLAAVVTRARRGGPVERRQLGWLGYGTAVAVAAAFLAPPAVNLVAALAVPLAVAVAVVRHRLYDLDVLVSRTLVAAVLLGGAAVVHAAVVGWAAALLGGRGTQASFVAAAVVAVAFHPARLRVDRAVARLLHGDRADPYALLRRLDARLREARSPAEALQEVVDVVAGGLRLPAVQVEVALPTGASVRASSGTPGPGAVDVPLSWHGDRVGTLRASPRRGSDRLEALDERLLAALGDRVAAVGAALRLTADLERSRGALVTAVEEERRRLRRDLHDGLGPQLAAVGMGLDTAQRLLERGAGERAGALLADARAQVGAAVTDVRRLVHGLRPPSLDQLGLVGALRATGPAAAADDLEVRVEACGPLDGLPAALEVAAYRIAQEALTNVVRHAGASRAVVTVRATPEDLRVEVLDDGRGRDPQAAAGVGLASMRERAAELGGEVVVQDAAGGGTLVAARLPWPREPRLQAAG